MKSVTERLVTVGIDLNMAKTILNTVDTLAKEVGMNETLHEQVKTAIERLDNASAALIGDEYVDRR